MSAAEPVLPFRQASRLVAGPASPLPGLLRQAFSGRYVCRGEVAEADCAIGFAFGAVLDGPAVRPGASNVALARFAREHLAHLPLILQGEIADAYGQPPAGRWLFRIDRHRRPGKYLDTYEVAVQSQEIMGRYGWRKAVLLAQGHHMPRAAQVCRRLGLYAIVPPGLDRVPFCPGSCQWWTRGRWGWFVREGCAMFYYRRRQWM
jgi:hypothetical protein